MKETVPASRKLKDSDAKELLANATRLVAMKGKKVSEFEVGKKTDPEAVAAMLGPTGNLRAPTIKTGKTLLVGFNEDVFKDTFA